jgi:hypothetical protein
MVGADHKKAARAAFSGLVSFREYMIQIVTVHVDTMDPNVSKCDLRHSMELATG